MNSNIGTFLQMVWNFFCSLKLTISTLILLAFTSIVGTVIQQNRPATEYLREYGDATYRFFTALQLTDMYHSWWFLALLVIFCCNLIACSIKRLPRVWLIVRRPQLMPDESQLHSPGAVDFQVKEPLSKARTTLATFLRGHFAAPVITEKDGQICLFAQKAPWARLGVYVTHLSILIVFVGAILGNLWGFKGYVNIAEGTASSQVWPEDGGKPIELGFSVRCDDFNVTYYPGSNRPREFMSILDIVDDGKEVVSDHKIIVNDPLSYKGITFYQSSYGPAGEPTIRMSVKPRSSGEVLKLNVREGEHVQLPDGYSFAVTGYSPAYDRFGPAVQLHVNSPDGRHGNPFVVLQNYPGFDAKRAGIFSFSLLGYDQPQFTGLQVKKDPGVWVVWLGCTLLVLGSLVAFFLSHRRIWVVLEDDDRGTRVRLCGAAHRNQPGFAIYFEDFTKTLMNEFALVSKSLEKGH